MYVCKLKAMILLHVFMFSDSYDHIVCDVKLKLHNQCLRPS